MNESILINKYIKPITSSSKEALSLLDDVAFIESNSNIRKSWIITTDCMIEGQHFFTNEDPKSIAYRLVISNLSDIATKGATPKYFTLTFCPKNIQELDPNWCKVFFDAIDKLQKKYKVKLIGGNVASTKSVTMFSLTVLGEVDSTQQKMLFRFNAKADDFIYMSGYAGDAYLGYCIIASKKGLIKEPIWLKTLDNLEQNYLINSYYYPKISLKLGQKLLNIANSCTDASDGILFSVKSICDSFNEKNSLKKSCRNFVLNARVNLTLKMFSDITQKVLSLYSIDQLKILTNLLTWGGDYNLICSIPKNKIKLIEQITKENFNNTINIVCIGKLLQDTEEKSLDLLDFNNKKISFNIKNYRNT